MNDVQKIEDLPPENRRHRIGILLEQIDDDQQMLEQAKEREQEARRDATSIGNRIREAQKELDALMAPYEPDPEPQAVKVSEPTAAVEKARGFETGPRADDDPR